MYDGVGRKIWPKVTIIVDSFVLKHTLSIYYIYMYRSTV